MLWEQKNIEVRRKKMFDGLNWKIGERGAFRSAFSQLKMNKITVMFSINPYVNLNTSIEIKADLPHPHDYLYMPTDYRHTDKYRRLVMTLVAFCYTRQCQVPNIDLEL